MSNQPDSADTEAQSTEDGLQSRKVLRRIEIKIPSGKTPERLDVFLARQVTELTRSKAQTAISEGALTVNGSTVKASYKIKPDDLLQVIPEICVRLLLVTRVNSSPLISTPSSALPKSRACV